MCEKPRLAYSRKTACIEEHHRRTIAEVLRDAKEPIENLSSGSGDSLLLPVQVPKAHFYGSDGQRLVEALQHGTAGRKSGKGLRGSRKTSTASRGDSGRSGSSSSGGREQPLAFSSSFECGNLLSAKLVQVVDAVPDSLEYELEMDTDTNTVGKSQWFYFSCFNAVPCSATIRIVNFRKGRSLYRSGMQPYVYSVQTAAQKGSTEWDATCCSEVTYTPNNRRTANGKPLFTLSFRYEFKHAKDTVYFAMHTPYSFSMLRDFLVKLGKNPKTRSVVWQDTLCRTDAGVQVPMLLVTSGLPPPDNPEVANSSSSQAARSRKLAEARRKPAIVLIARQHPGEVVSSWVMSGLIRFLVSSSLEAAALRDRFCFHIVPMVNVDGVIHGNSRCTLLGYDPNRCWANPSVAQHPVIFALREYILATQRRSGVELFLDIHGHSQRTGAFFYGCCAKEVRSALFPKLASLGTRDVDFDGCRWRFHKTHDTSARAVVHNDCGVKYSYTLETSFFGERVPSFPSFGCPVATQMRLLREVLFTPSRSESIGCIIGRAMLRFFRLEAGIKAFLPPPPLPVNTDGEEEPQDPYSREGFETFDGLEEQVLPWLTMDRLRLAHADFTLAELEAQSSTCQNLRDFRATTDVEGNDDDAPASDSDCEEEHQSNIGGTMINMREETALESDLGRTGTSGSGTSVSSGKGLRHGGRGRRSGGTRKGGGEDRGHSGSGKRHASGRSASRKYQGSEPAALETAAPQCHGSGAAVKGSGGRVEGEDAADIPGSRGLELVLPDSDHLDADRTCADVPIDCSGWGQLLLSNCSSPCGASSRPSSSAGLNGSNSRPISRQNSRQNSHNSMLRQSSDPALALGMRAADWSTTFQTFLEGKGGLANNSASTASTGGDWPNQRPVTRRPRITQGSGPQPGVFPEAAKLATSLTCAPSSWVDPPLGGAAFAAFAAVDEYGQITYLSSSTNSQDACGLLPRLHISSVCSPPSPSKACLSGGGVGAQLLDDVESACAVTNAALPSTPVHRRPRASSTSVLTDTGHDSSISVGAALGVPTSRQTSGGQTSGGAAWPGGVFVSKLQRKCRGGVGVEAQTQDEADSLLKRGLWDRWIAR